MRNKKILVAGIGDLLRSDDGFGPKVVSKLENINLPKNVIVKDYGIAVLELIFDLKDFNEVIFVDVIDFDGEVGEIKIIKPEPKIIDEKEAMALMNFTLHEVDLRKIIDLAYSLKILPKDVLIIGCKPKNLSFGLGLSEEVNKAVDKAVDIIKNHLRIIC